MGNAIFAGQPFRLDPTSISWGYEINTVDHKAVGGKVVQVLGARLGDMTVSGTFGMGGWQEQLEFLDRMKKLGNQQVAMAAERNSIKDPFQFIYPAYGWDFLVWLKGYSETPGGGPSVNDTVTNFAPKWSLTLFIVENNVGLEKVAMDQFIARISAGLGWHQNKYNGPLSIAPGTSDNGGGRTVLEGQASNSVT